jgi:Ca2+-binding RTX toxin-like protein
MAGPRGVGAKAGCRWSRLLPLVVALFVLAPVEAASAGTATLTGGTLLYDAAPTEVNRVYVVEDVGGFRIVDVTAPVTAGVGCASVNANEAACPGFSSGLVIHLITRDMNDYIKVSGGRYQLARLEAGDGADELEGGFSSNILDGGPGADIFGRGAIGQDRIDYSSRTDPVTVTLGDGLANDGEVGEGDLIGDFIGHVSGGQAGDTISCVLNAALQDVDPRLLGQGGDDVLTCNRYFSRLEGGSGDDTLSSTGFDSSLSGGGGADLLTGGGGAQDLLGQAGQDQLDGRGGVDFLGGGSEADRLIGGTGRDWLFGGPGPDRLLARDGKRDSLNGGTGHDRARVDRALDRIKRIEELF